MRDIILAIRQNPVTTLVMIIGILLIVLGGR